ncbi:hypothetical protein AM363_04110 [Citrobacter freundii]|uniref:Uncharacterized protein n=1 Tax=Citrobacter freundii TaxID=546 RepID=A0AB33GUA5_CITFR|nr:hypothetical protein AM363_04110 [Citrobacter freundii]POV58542.1 hypothetical protein C3404_25585 [Citrobacter freundii complex sp. CFNIH11]AYL49226.1 hypothetical protein CUC46_21550 [Citrobacter freundii]AYL59299.1 hypothetical protein CUC48_23435 [Citrobacter freundii]PMC99177.1 hypothetical protein CJ200_24755 [Citrobacter freundii]
MLAALVHTGHVVNYTPGDSLNCCLATIQMTRIEFCLFQQKRGGKIVDKITAHVKANISSPQSQSDRTDQRQHQHPWWWRC